MGMEQDTIRMKPVKEKRREQAAGARTLPFAGDGEVRRLSEHQGLVTAAKKGDQQAFGRLYEQIYQDLYKFAYYVLKNEQDAQDVVSEAVMDAWAGIRKLKEDDAFRGWMFKILSVKCKRKLKSYVERSRISPLEEAESLPTEGAELSVDLKQAISQLSDEERMIVSLTIFGGYDSAEIGLMLKLNRNTVRSKHSRALAKLKLFLGEKQENTSERRR